jgi:hypothetical protein
MTLLSLLGNSPLRDPEAGSGPGDRWKDVRPEAGRGWRAEGVSVEHLDKTFDQTLWLDKVAFSLRGRFCTIFPFCGVSAEHTISIIAQLLVAAVVGRGDEDGASGLVVLSASQSPVQKLRIRILIALGIGEEKK